VVAGLSAAIRKYAEFCSPAHVVLRSVGLELNFGVLHGIFPLSFIRKSFGVYHIIDATKDDYASMDIYNKLRLEFASTVRYAES
jgi:hypothetical protein